MYKRVPGRLSRHELSLVALRYFEQLGHDSQHRIFKFFAWQPTKTNGSSGGYLDYPKLAGAKLDGMITAEIGRFLVACALASDLYCPTYLSGATLAKDSTLAKEAAHYKVNSGRVLQEVRERLAKKSSKQNNHSKPQSTATPKR